MGVLYLVFDKTKEEKKKKNLIEVHRKEHNEKVVLALKLKKGNK